MSLNGVRLGRTANQHRTYRFDARHALRPGRNELEVRFDSAWHYAREVEQRLGPLPNAYPTGFNFIRKMAANFGWDWGPQLVTAGIWKGVRLEEWSVARLRAVRPSTGFDGAAALALVVDIERADSAAKDELTMEVCVAGVERSIAVPPGDSTVTWRAAVPDADAWWPRGMGDQPVYPLTVHLNHGDAVLDGWARRIGFRTATLDTSADADGRAFTLAVNGVPVFVRGANWIPDDCFPSRVSRERYRERIGQAVDANLNLLRVWGGGIYESDDFYELCDESGVLVWQDFLFACAAYPEETAPRRGRGGGARQRHAAHAASQPGALERMQREHLGLVRLGMAAADRRSHVGPRLLPRRPPGHRR